MIFYVRRPRVTVTTFYLLPCGQDHLRSWDIQSTLKMVTEQTDEQIRCLVNKLAYVNYQKCTQWITIKSNI